MSNDSYEEILVSRHSSSDNIKKYAVIAVTVAVIAAGILFFQPLFLLIGCVLGFLDYYFILPMFDVEFEYLYVNGDIDIDKILAKRKRKRVASFTKDNLEIMAPTGSDHLAEASKDAKVEDYTSQDPDVKTWTLVYGGEKGSRKVLLELTDEIAQDMRRYAPRNVYFS